MHVRQAVVAIALVGLATTAAAQTCPDRYTDIKAKTATVQNDIAALAAGQVNGVLSALSLLAQDQTALMQAEVAFDVAGCIGTVTPPPPPPPVASCGMQLGGATAFCDTFDSAFAINSRAGQLNSTVWGVSRAIGGINPGQNAFNVWPKTDLVKCDGTTATVNPPNDVIICNGQLREASSDNVTKVHDAGDVTVLAMYPKQPFDWAGRTGTVSFDVSNDSHGNHAAWPEFWISDLPIPTPFTFQGAWISNPQHGLGIRFAGNVGPGQWGGCPERRSDRTMDG
jgi:hypothetical protein